MLLTKCMPSVHFFTGTTGRACPRGNLVANEQTFTPSKMTTERYLQIRSKTVSMEMMANDFSISFIFP